MAQSLAEFLDALLLAFKTKVDNAKKAISEGKVYRGTYKSDYGKGTYSTTWKETLKYWETQYEVALAIKEKRLPKSLIPKEPKPAQASANTLIASPAQIEAMVKAGLTPEQIAKVLGAK